MCTEGICVECWLIPLIDTQLTFNDILMEIRSMLDKQLNRYSVNTRLTLEWHLNRHLINIRSTLDWQSINSTQRVDQLMCIDGHAMACLQNLAHSQPTVNWDVDKCSLSNDRDVDQVRVLIKMLIECWSRVNRGCQLVLNCGHPYHTWSIILAQSGFISSFGTLANDPSDLGLGSFMVTLITAEKCTLICVLCC